MNNWGFSNKENGFNRNNIYNNIYIPTEYRYGILKHILLNYSNINEFSTPLFLAVQGVRGEGKTFMIKKICEYYNIEYTFISGSSLCGQNEGDSIKFIKKEYETSCVEVSLGKKMEVLVIDDFHLSIATNFDKNVSRTTNAQVLVSYLMNLADNPYIKGVRIPIILIGNDFTNIYSALIRNGRMNFLNWECGIEEKINIVYQMFKKYYPVIDFYDIKRLVQKYSDKYIAFFNGVLQTLYFDGFNNVIDEFDLRKGLVSINEVDTLIKKNLFISKNIDYEILCRYAEIQSKNREEKFD